jgi:hypothetical protein
MPIRPEYRRFYEGEPWQATRRLVLRRAGDACECQGECGKHEGYRCARANYSDYRNARGVIVRVVLTIGHLDHDPTHHDPERLRAFCQECHLGYDHRHHVRNMMATRRAKLQNLELFE